MADPRKADVTRQTKETQIKVSLTLDGTGEGEIATGIPFMDHMLDLFSRHGFFDLSIDATGDIEIDYHHLVEDMGICLGQAFREALGNKAGIRRYGFFALPMDETLVTVALDLSNRAYLVWNVVPTITMVRDFNVQLFKEFFQAFANEVACNIHVCLEHGEEPHHVAEAIFKGFAKSMDIATQQEERLAGKIPSTKGTLSA